MCVPVQQHPNTARQSAFHGHFTGIQQGNVRPSHLAGSACRVCGSQILCHAEDHAGQILGQQAGVGLQDG